MLLRRQQFACVLRVEIASRVDVVNEGRVSGDCAFSTGLSLAGRLFETLHFDLSLSSAFAHVAEFDQARLLLVHPLTILFGQCGHQTHGLTELTQVRRRQEQSCVLPTPQFVERHQTSLEIGQRGTCLCRQYVNLLVETRKSDSGRLRLFLCAFEFGRSNFPRDFELAQIAQERPLFGRESIGFVSKGTQPIRCTSRQRVALFAIGLLSIRRRHKQNRSDGCDAESARIHPCAAEYNNVRILGLDIGRRRVGLAVSDTSATLARPYKTLMVSDTDAVDRVIEEVRRLASDEDGLATVVVGLPRSLDGTATDQTRAVERFIAALREHVTVPVTTEDERLSSREAESRLALRERDWKKRKARLDAAAAAVILQDYLDRGRARV